MLETTLSTEFIPGTNLSGDLACADWRFLLPRLDLDNILFLGVPPVATLSVFSALGQRIFVASTDLRQLRELCRAGRQRGIANLHTVSVAGFADLPFPQHSVSLIWLTGGKGSPNPVRSPGVIAELDRLLQPEGVIYFEIRGLLDNILGHRAIKRLSQSRFASPQIFWLTPQTGEMRTALPAEDAEIARHFFDKVLFGQSPKRRALSRLGALLSRLGLLRHVALRRGAVIQRSGMNGHSKHLPQYLVSLAEKAGINLTGYRCSFSARGKYNSNKVIFYLFQDSRKEPEAVVKMVRSPQFNRRLEIEYRVLSLLTEQGLVNPDTFPQPLFLDYHRGHALLGLRTVDGYPFRTRTKASANCPFAHAAMRWITQLGSASANQHLAIPEKVAAALTRLFNRFTEIYKISDRERNFLEEQIATLGGAPAPIPLVFQHGDPGTWNIMVSESDKVAFLDWEAAEPRGLPLWDLFYFMRSFGSWISRTQGKHSALANFAEHFLVASPLSVLLSEVTQEYCRRVGLERYFIEPLFYSCWMHRALKESTGLTADTLAGGHYVNLLQLCIRRRNELNSSSLFSQA